MDSTFSKLLERTFNRYLQLDPEGLQGFSELNGKVIEIKLRGLDQSFFILPNANCIHIVEQYEGEPDTRMCGTPIALAKLGLSNTVSSASFSDDIEIRGDLETGKRFKELLDAVEVDWEEPLARIGGDVFAHQVGNAFRGAKRWGTQSLDRFGGNFSEYLREEARLLPTRIELENLYEEVDELRMATDRIEARVRRLSQSADFTRQTGEKL